MRREGVRGSKGKKQNRRREKGKGGFDQRGQTTPSPAPEPARENFKGGKESPALRRADPLVNPP